MKKIFLISVAVSAIILGGCAPRGEGEEVVDEGTDVVEATDGTDEVTATDSTETMTPISVSGGAPVVYFDFDKYNIKPEMQAVVNSGADKVPISKSLSKDTAMNGELMSIIKPLVCAEQTL